MIKQKIARAIIVHDNKILLCHNLKAGHYFLPGGKMDQPGETAIETLKREFIEEAGATVKDLTLVAEVENTFPRNGEEVEEVGYIHLGRLEDYNVASKEDHIGFVWLPLSEFTTANFRPIKTVPQIISIIETNKQFWLN